MLPNWKQHFIDKRAEQCPVGTSFILELLKALQPKVYVETGCAHLATFELYHSLLPKEGLAIGIDLRRYAPWASYNNEAANKGYCPSALFDGGLQNATTEFAVKSLLSKFPIDFLFIDGDHNEEGVKKDWETLGPYVRPGGLVVLHDYDPQALERGDREGQGAAILCKELEQKGAQINSIKYTAIGTAYFYKS